MNTAATAAGCSRRTEIAAGERQDVSEDGRHLGLDEADRQPGLANAGLVRTQLDPYTTSLSRTKEGKLVQTGYIMFNPQTNTMTLSLNAANGPNSYVLVFEKQ